MDAVKRFISNKSRLSEYINVRMNKQVNLYTACDQS